MSNRLTIAMAAIILSIMFILAITSARNDSATMDELAHLPAGYSYLTQQDMRLNPEHPPLIKDLAATPLIIMSALGEKINFPDQIKAWTQDINGQWDFGSAFLYDSDNNTDKIIFWGRLPIILLSLLLGFFIFKWARELYGNTVSIFALFLYSFSPTILAHSRLVTTDIAAAFGFFTALYYFIKWFKNPSIKNLIIAGIFLGIAQLLKFSLFMLYPIFLFLIIIWILIKNPSPSPSLPLIKGGFPLLFKERVRARLVPIFNLFLIFIISFIVIYPVYQFHVWHYPIELQQRDINFVLNSNPSQVWTNALHWAADKPILRAYAQYLFGLTMVAQRASGGNTSYFLGEVSNQAWASYFPIVYAIKEPLALHIMTIVVLLYLCFLFIKNIKKYSLIKKYLSNYFPEFSMLTIIGLYWFSSITSNLNIGVRHVLPTFPFIYLLVSGQIAKIFKVFDAIVAKLSNMSLRARLPRPEPIGDGGQGGTPTWQSHYSDGEIASEYLAMTKGSIWRQFPKIILILPLGWYLFANLSIYPHYLSYFNELIGGSKNGHKYVVDSNLDWGQDLKRLAQWVEKNNIDKIYVDYFGGGSPEYYLKEKLIPYHSHYAPPKGYLAVSATFIQTSKRDPKTSYAWLEKYTPIAIIGNSIFVYNFNL